jgi:Zn-dependent peptidase ImmA (M78 family)/transcriptional regulator with XRE-family HTH domain
VLTPEGIYDYIGARIRSEREDASISQGDLGSRVGLTRTSISNIELGRQKIQIDTLYGIAAALGVPTAALMPPSPDQAKIEERYLRKLSLAERDWVKNILGALPGRESTVRGTKTAAVIDKDPEILLRQAGVKAPPIPVEQMARQYGAEIRYAPYEGEMAGLLFNNGGRIVIGLNSQDTKLRHRFAIAHELGHLALHADKELHVDRTFSSVRSKGSTMESDPVESAANDFAVGLLVPPSMITSDLKGKKIDYSNGEMIGGLAERYKVGLEVMIYRLMKLNALTVS